MKRSVALNEIKIAGWEGDQKQAALVAARHGIGRQAFQKAFLDGQKMKDRGELRPESARGK